MNKEIDTLNNLFHINFVIFIFWIASIGYFLSSVSFDSVDKTLLQYSPLILSYIVAYLIFIHHKDKNRININKKKAEYSQIILKANLVFIGVIILMTSSMSFFDSLCSLLQSVLMVIYLFLLICVALAFPLLLIFSLLKLAK